ncbi:Hypothetical protein A7982_12791 [Minicystis rosea]|nr:Hypothetical protein A7982_12791 [Minicystis rosea]
MDEMVFGLALAISAAFFGVGCVSPVEDEGEAPAAVTADGEVAIPEESPIKAEPANDDESIGEVGQACCGGGGGEWGYGYRWGHGCGGGGWGGCGGGWGGGWGGGCGGGGWGGGGWGHGCGGGGGGCW